MAGSLPAASILCVPLKDPGLKKRDGFNNSEPGGTPPNAATKDKSKLLAKAAPQRADSVSPCSSLYVDHMDIIITRGMNQRIFDPEPKITRHLN